MMLKKIMIQSGVLVLAAALLFSSGCAGRSPASRFYVLSPITPTGAEKADISGINSDTGINILPVALPKYLRKSQIVTRSGDNELQLAEYHRWAGKIEEDIGRVIAENLNHLLGIDQVLSAKAMEQPVPDYTVKLEIIRFDGRLGGDLELLVRWTISDRQDRVVYGLEATRIVEPTTGSSHADMVAAQSRALFAFSRELAAVLKKLADG